jgi:ATP-dependent DNA helicase DinG
VKGPDAIEALLGPKGALERVMPGYEHRPQQVALAQAVERALRERSYLLAEAGTGTGKTLAYLIPAVLSGRRVLVSTATKNLQEQIFFKDIPFLREKLGLELDAALLKGRSNYLCQKRFAAFEAAPALRAEDLPHWSTLQEWAHATQTGDRSEVNLPDYFPTWTELSTTSQTCIGTRCPLYEPCFVTQARRRAEAASLVVVNHALFFADLSVRAANGEGILPACDAVILDEAHALPDVATEHFGSYVSNHRFEELGRDAQRALPAEDARAGLLSALALKLDGVAERFFRAVPAKLGLSHEVSLRLTPGALAGLERELTTVTEALSALGAYVMGAEEPEVAALARRAGELATELELVVKADSDGYVFWAEQRGRGVFLRAAPVDIAQVLARSLYRAVDTLVLTSATLRTGGTFSYFARAMGLEPPPEEASPVHLLAVDSPFDFEQQAALYLAPHLPEPNAPGFVDAAADEVVALTRLTGGRAFALFTSLKNMAAVHARAKHRLPYQVLLQGERPRAALLEAFRAEPSVLFASQSFWEGVDVPGDALSLVIIDRLPFASPADPLTAARIDRMRDRGEEPFSGFQLPAAALSLRQGFGRLIRTRNDRGVVAVLDRRLATRSYGRVFLQSLPPAKRFSTLEGLADWLGQGAAATARAT